MQYHAPLHPTTPAEHEQRHTPSWRVLLHHCRRFGDASSVLTPSLELLILGNFTSPTLGPTLCWEFSPNFTVSTPLWAAWIVMNVFRYDFHAHPWLHFRYMRTCPVCWQCSGPLTCYPLYIMYISVTNKYSPLSDLGIQRVAGVLGFHVGVLIFYN